MNSVFKNKKLLNILNYIFIPIITSILLLLINGWSPSDLTLNPVEKIKKLADEKEATQLFSNDEFQLYYIDNDDGATHYAFSKRFGVWNCNYYPHRNDIIGITHGKNFIYYYGEFASDKNYDYIENKQDEKIYPNKIELNNNVLSVYQIPKIDDEKVIYHFKNIEDPINNEMLLSNGEITFYKYENGKHKEFEYTIRQLQQEEPYLWGQIEKTIESADEGKEIEDGRVYSSQNDLEYRIIVKYNTGDFLNLEKGHKGYDWTGEVSYDIELEGQHSNTISIYTRDYSKISLYEKTFGESHVYPVTISENLSSYFKSLK